MLPVNEPRARASRPCTPSGQAASEQVAAAFGSPFEAPSLGEGWDVQQQAAAKAAVGAPDAAAEGAAEAAAPPPLQLTVRTCQHHHAVSSDGGSGPLSLASTRPEVWGWLQPGRPGLPHVLLQGKGVALGRGKEAYEERLPLLLLGSSPATSPSGSGGGSRRALSVDGSSLLDGDNKKQRASTFVEIADGRVSRLHCWVTRSANGEAVLEDWSTNGSFLNGEKLQRGSSAPLKDGDRISLVLSVAPLHEQFFVYHRGDPRMQDPMAAEWVEAASLAWVASPSGSPPFSSSPTAAYAEGRRSPRRLSGPVAYLSRSKTSTYTTVDTTTLEDLQCQICLGTLRSCVALEPCGHNFCATCLSHHFAALLGSGQPLACPLRCSAPEWVVVNMPVRRLVSLRTHSWRQRQLAEAAAAAGSAAAAAPGLGTLHETPSIGSSNGLSGSSVDEASGVGMEPEPVQKPSTMHPPACNELQPLGAEGEAGSSSRGPDAAEPVAVAGFSEIPAQQQQQQQEQLPGSPFAVAAAVSMGSIRAEDEQPQGQQQQQIEVPEPASSVACPWGEEGEEGEELGMNPLCPLDDELLPMNASGLKRKQLAHNVDLLREAEGVIEAMGALEAIARLGWSDDSVREEIASLGGIEGVIACMQKYSADDGVQCNGCLALMALVRGEGEVSNANKWRVAKADGVACVAAAMRAHRDQPMVQLSALLLCVPLALDNAFLQVQLCNLALGDVLLAIKHHPEEVEVVGKALVTLGVLGQGTEDVHEMIRDMIITAGAPSAIAGVLRALAKEEEEVLWAALFALAVVVRESSARYVEHLLALAAAGVGPALREAMVAYRAEVAAQGIEGDEMVLKAGDFLVDSLSKAEHLLRLRRQRRLYLALAVGVACLAGYRWAAQRLRGVGRQRK